MKKILCFGNVTDKYKNAIESAMRECPNIAGWEHASDTDDLPNTYDEFVLMKCDIHSDDFIRRVIAINKKLISEKFYLTHCFVLSNKSGNRTPFILSDAACVPMPDENQLTHIIQNAISLYSKMFGEKRVPLISLVSAGGDTNTKISPLLHSWYESNVNNFPTHTVRIEQLDVALDLHVRNEKHISGKTADIIIVDNINTGNAILKSLTVLSDNWYGIGFLIGAKNTVILNSRSANEYALIQNIVMACK